MVNEVSEPGRNGTAAAMQMEERRVYPLAESRKESVGVNTSPNARHEEVEVCCVPAEWRFPD